MDFYSLLMQDLSFILLQDTFHGLNSLKECMSPANLSSPCFSPSSYIEKLVAAILLKPWKKIIVHNLPQADVTLRVRVLNNSQLLSYQSLAHHL